MGAVCVRRLVIGVAKKQTASRPPRKRVSPARGERATRGRALRSPGARTRTKVGSGKTAQRSGIAVAEVAELDELRRELERAAGASPPFRWNADPEDVQRSVAQLVLTLVEFIRRLLERQAIRRMEAGTLSAQQTEDVGRALMQLEATLHDIAARFGLSLDDLNLDLGPAGKLI
jgi:hypothetical protein